ncbi:unnamed protein product [Thlaspi arvense]|uniref:Uncharacterized protein n=1 Tax=Thlaspi arvense TaxID=13288 RepID=A0AAU9R416_THLAR|nr:unnamed protein product [Thlaspi arvense]
MEEVSMVLQPISLNLKELSLLVSFDVTQSSRDGVVSVFPNELLQLQTTRSWEFMGFGDNIKHVPEIESDVIIGVIDGGIWPESRSFADNGFEPPPKRWKGTCAGGHNFTCNKKVIGARYYIEDSARDIRGHGSHTSSTAAGNRLERQSFHGLAPGTMRGGVPSARIASYKVCGPDGCTVEAILAALDDAIADGVDVITISIVGDNYAFDKDTLAIGSFHAMSKGILTVASAGNSGPSPGKACNIAPWILTVAASSTDRKLVTKVVTGDGKTIVGISINVLEGEEKYPFAYGKTASSSCTQEQARNCDKGCLDLVKGKITVCDKQTDVRELKAKGARGVIYKVSINDHPRLNPIPVVTLDDTNYQSLISYITSNPNPVGCILKSETVKDTDAPIVASFSSRGPNTIVSDILKPDITAPGVSIFAAYSPVAATAIGESVDSYFLSGTSMSCPHVAGIAAYVKTLRPHWSPSAIKSALMTTAWGMNGSRNIGEEFAYGSGHVNPIKAADPGLVYETSKEDYLNMLCSLKYTSQALGTISGGNFTCSKESKLTVRDLNYPSMAAKVSSSSDITFSRTVTNVGKAGSTYKAQLSSDPRLSIRVDPNTLSFNSLGEKKSFIVTISRNGLSSISGIAAGSLVWSDGSYSVRSPVVIYS